MVSLPNNFSNSSLPSKAKVPTSTKAIRQDVIPTDKSSKKPLDSYDESITEENQILTENLNSENDI